MNESRFVMTFVTILGVIEMLCSFRLFLERKTGREIPESSRSEFLEKFLANNFALSDSRFAFVRKLLAIRQKVPRAKFLGSYGIYCFSSLCIYGSLKNAFATNSTLSEHKFRFRRFILLVQKKEVISMNYGSSTSCRKPWG